MQPNWRHVLRSGLCHRLYPLGGGGISLPGGGCPSLLTAYPSVHTLPLYGRASLASGSRFSKVVFNFPHAGAGIKDQAHNNLTNQRLLAGFFASARALLTTPLAVMFTPQVWVGCEDTSFSHESMSIVSPAPLGKGEVVIAPIYVYVPYHVR